jgi:hypothetical protein
MSAFEEGNQRVFNILQKYVENDPVYYSIGIGHGFAVIGRKISGKIEIRHLDYSNNYEHDVSEFTRGCKQLITERPSWHTKPFPSLLD